MKDALDIVNNFYRAFEEKNFEKARSFLNDDYTFKGPMMQFNSADECIAQMKECGFDASHKTIRTISDGSQVVVIFDWMVCKPFEGTFRMCECFQIKNEKIASAELFFDTANFPKMDKNAA
ncbi:MAG: nuclear transport factor 2 family protein [Nitrospina sp.]|jgi:predicted SnoaL-like aldol condensation-catalyzing enzyme|nr:nuclear transport factor 2 family protein [Nitrospina sp.]MBT5632404.1 nuclear transport factor 2 family protein [Nitrospina sp.]